MDKHSRPSNDGRLRFFSYWFICCRIFAISLVV